DGGLVGAHLEADELGAVLGIEAGEEGAIGLSRGLEGLADGELVGHHRRLVGPPDAEARTLVQGKPRDVAVLEGDRAALGRDAAREDLEEAGLAGAVGSDDAEPLPGIDPQADVAQDLAAPQVEMNAGAGKEGAGRAAPCRVAWT